MTQSPSEKDAPSAKQGIFRLDGKTAIVTGGGSGIGRAIGVRFAAQGAKIHILDLSFKDAEGTCQQIGAAGGRAEAHVCDVTDQKQVIATFQQLAAESGDSLNPWSGAAIRGLTFTLEWGG
jgi:NAD(P)-dependent dehydrogenase (short-subunit alcohol dehydrogenase family)